MGGCRPGGGRIPDQKKFGWNQDLLMFPRWVLAALIQEQSKVKKKKVLFQNLEIIDQWERKCTQI